MTFSRCLSELGLTGFQETDFDYTVADFPYKNCQAMTSKQSQNFDHSSIGNYLKNTIILLLGKSFFVHSLGLPFWQIHVHRGCEVGAYIDFEQRHSTVFAEVLTGIASSDTTSLDVFHYSENCSYQEIFNN